MGWLIAVALASVASDPGLARYEKTEIHMGSSFTIVLYAPSEEAANRALAAAFARIKQLDESLSDYREESELSCLSAAAPTREPVAVSEDLWRVLSRAQEVSKLSDGAFDVTVGPLTRLWRRSRRQRELPTDERLAEARAAVGYQHLKLQSPGRRVSLELPRMRLDLGGIGQGFAADEALGVLRRQGLTRALVNASGDIAIGDPPPDSTGWKVGVTSLKRDVPPTRFVHLSNTAISTSGDLFQFVEIGGRRYSHIVDPKTGLGLTRRSSVTVIAPDCTGADALATTFSVMPVERTIELADRLPGVAVLVLLEQDGVVREVASSRWK